MRNSLKKIRHNVVYVFKSTRNIISKFKLILYLVFIKKKISLKVTLPSLKSYGRSALLSVLLRAKLKKSLFPRPRIVIGLTLECNIKCVFCLSHSPLIAEKEERLSKLTWFTGRAITKDDAYLRFETFKNIIDDLEYLNPSNIFLAGNGEVFMHPRILEVFTYIKSKKKLKYKNIALSTNGVLLSENIAKKIIETGVARINFSLNAAKPSSYRIMHFADEDVFYKIINNIKGFMKMLKTYDKQPGVIVSFVLCKRNYKEITEMVKLADSLGVKNATFSMMYFCKGKNHQLKNYILDTSGKEELKKLIFDALIEATKRKILTNLNHLLNILKRGSKDCFKPTIRDAYTLSVYANGIVSPYDFPYNMGNIYKRSILDIWYSPKYIEFRNMIKENVLKHKYMPNRPFCFRCNVSEKETECCRIIF